MDRKFAGNVLLLIAMLLMIAVLLVFNASAAGAQGETPVDPLPLVTLVPDVVQGDPVTPIIVDGGTDWQTVGVIIGFIAAFALIGYKAISEAAKGVPPAQIDADTANRIRQEQTNREQMAALERAYESTNAANKLALDTAVKALTLIAPFLTALQSDDAALAFLRDVQEKGAPVSGSVNVNEGFKPPA